MEIVMPNIYELNFYCIIIIAKKWGKIYKYTSAEEYR